MTATNDHNESKQHVREAKNDATCYKCGQLGHIARWCKREKSRNSQWCSTWCSKTHSDRMCRRKARNRLDKVNQACEAAYYSHDGVKDSFAHKTSAHASQVKSRKPDTLLVKCGATAHVISNESKFTKFDKT